jgi:hypothetical protein
VRRRRRETDRIAPPDPCDGKIDLQANIALTRPDGYVFIVTYGRSGSTLLQNVLNSIDGYCIRGENNNSLFHLARAWEAIDQSEPIRGMRHKKERSEQTHPWYGAELIESRNYARSLANVFVREVLNPPVGTRVAGFKEIRFHINGPHFRTHLNFIHDVFPNARFIFNTRSHAAVEKSGWWAEMDPAKVRETLSWAEQLFMRYLEEYPERGIHMHYDDYAGEPQALERLFDFLGERYDAPMVRRIMDTRLTHLKTPAG